MNEELKNVNFITFQDKLSKVGVDCSKLMEKYGDKIKDAPYSSSIEYPGCYKGGLVDIVLKHIAVQAVKLNKILPANIMVNQDTLVKVCLLHQMGKCVSLIENDNEWEINSKGKLWKFQDFPFSLRNGQLSLYICQECAIPFNEMEIEAMIVMDRTNGDDQAKYFSSPLANIIRISNEIVDLYFKNINK
jgi:hypothetical protein